jgi:hypothetical protein
LSRDESTAHFASGTVVPCTSRESRGSMSPTRESLDAPYRFGVLGEYDAPRVDDFTTRLGLRPSMDSSYMSGPYSEASPDRSTTGNSREQAATPHAGEMREKRGAVGLFSVTILVRLARRGRLLPVIGHLGYKSVL